MNALYFCTDIKNRKESMFLRFFSVFLYKRKFIFAPCVIICGKQTEEVRHRL